MGWKALRLGLGALAAAALLAGCDDSGDIGYGGNLWAMTPQEDYYPDDFQVEDNPPLETTTLFETKEHEWGTGGAGQAADLGETTRRDASAWASNFYSELVPGAETGFWHLTAPSQTGTGRELKAENGIWVQGTSSVEQGARAFQFLK